MSSNSINGPLVVRNLAALMIGADPSHCISQILKTRGKRMKLVKTSKEDGRLTLFLLLPVEHELVLFRLGGLCHVPYGFGDRADIALDRGVGPVSLFKDGRDQLRQGDGL